MTNEEAISRLHTIDGWGEREHEAIAMAIKALEQPEPCKDTISRAAAIYIASGYCHPANIAKELAKLPAVQPDIIRCKDCKFGEQDEVGRWFCGSLGCQIGNEDGSGFCADAERRTDEA